MTTRFQSSQFNWIDRLPHDRQRLLKNRFSSLTARQGGDAFRNDDQPSGLFRVISGRANMYIEAEDGRIYFINWYLPGESFGEIATLDGNKHTATVALAPETTLHFMSIGEIKRLRQDEPWLTDALFEAAAVKFRSAIHAHLARLSMKPEELVLDRLRFLARSDGRARPTDCVLEITQDLIAKMLSLSLRRVSDALATLEAEGHIRREYGKIVLPSL